MLKVILILLLLLFSGCSLTPKIEYIKEDKYIFQKIEQPKIRTIRVYKDDIPLYEAYIKHLRNIIDFHNEQIDDYLKSR